MWDLENGVDDNNNANKEIDGAMALDFEGHSVRQDMKLHTADAMLS